MLKYLIQDFTWALGYLPYGILAAFMLFVILFLRNTCRTRDGRAVRPMLPSVCFYTYLLIIFCLTLLSRESGSESRIDLILGSSLGINARNDAYIVENILLFVPYGFCLGWKLKKSGSFFGKFIWNLLLGLSTTVLVECLQLITGRGIFQIDDILTNTLGCAAGVLIFLIFERK